MQITSGQQYNVGEKPTVILYIYINHHVGTPLVICAEDGIHEGQDPFLPRVCHVALTS